MLIREYTEGDLDALRAIHAAQGFDYALPDLRNPLFVTKLVLARDLAPAPAEAQPLPQGDGPAVFPLGRAQPAAPYQTSPGNPADAPQEHPQETVAALSATASEGNCGPTDAHGQILGAVLLRLTAEAYLLLDPRAGTPRDRWQWLLALHEAARHDAWQRGLEDVHAWLPPSIAQKFGRRLARLGWRRDDSWTPYSKKLVAP